MQADFLFLPLSFHAGYKPVVWCHLQSWQVFSPQFTDLHANCLWKDPPKHTQKSTQLNCQAFLSPVKLSYHDSWSQYGSDNSSFSGATILDLAFFFPHLPCPLHWPIMPFPALNLFSFLLQSCAGAGSVDAGQLPSLESAPVLAGGAHLHEEDPADLASVPTSWQLCQSQYFHHLCLHTKEQGSCFLCYSTTFN